MRQRITTSLELAGFTAITSGVTISFGVGAGLIVGGILAVLTGYLVGSRA